MDYEKLTDREIDCLVCEKIFGLTVKKVKPDWYDREVTLFVNSASGLIDYSYDTNGCNAMMFRNGVDNKQGNAAPMPFFSEEIDAVMEIVEHLSTTHYFSLCGKAGFWQADFLLHAQDELVNGTCESIPRAICIAALRSIEKSAP